MRARNIVDEDCIANAVCGHIKINNSKVFRQPMAHKHNARVLQIPQLIKRGGVGGCKV